MTTTWVVAAQVEGSHELCRQLADRWPVSRGELDTEIDKAKAEYGWETFGVAEPFRRGPYEKHAVDPDTGEEFSYWCWQLCAWVTVGGAV